jgi:hypothetical protein
MYMQMLENSRTKLQSQFDEWFNNLHSRQLYVDSNVASAPAEDKGGQSQASIISPPTSSKHKANSDSFSSSATSHDSASFAAGSKSNTSTISDAISSKAASISSISPKNRLELAASKDESVNEDILAFYQAKEEMLKRRPGLR